MKRIFKFGGASVKDNQAIRNMTSIVRKEMAVGPLVVIVSALGKTTNDLEEILNLWWNKDSPNNHLDRLYEKHVMIWKGLSDSEFPLDLTVQFNSLRNMLGSNDPEMQNFDFAYDQIVSLGEVFSTLLIHNFWNEQGLESHFLDARKCVITSDLYRHGKIHWEKTISNIKKVVIDPKGLYLSQGFIGSEYRNGKTTTLGREGSDFTGAIFAHALDADSLTVWKDVPGIMNADPKIIEPNYTFSNLSYFESAELTYYGASVIHPNTIKPLAEKGIPIFVRSFHNVNLPGTCIGEKGSEGNPPTFILKRGLTMASFTTRDLAFIETRHHDQIIGAFQKLGIQIQLTQNSAISYTLLAQLNSEEMDEIKSSLEKFFSIKYNQGLNLITIKNYRKSDLEYLESQFKLLLRQQSRKTIRCVVDEDSDSSVSFSL